VLMKMRNLVNETYRVLLKGCDSNFEVNIQILQVSTNKTTTLH